jgi:hypothetical protein
VAHTCNTRKGGKRITSSKLAQAKVAARLSLKNKIFKKKKNG